MVKNQQDKPIISKRIKILLAAAVILIVVVILIALSNLNIGNKDDGITVVKENQESSGWFNLSFTINNGSSSNGEDSSGDDNSGSFFPLDFSNPVMIAVYLLWGFIAWRMISGGRR